MVKLCKCGSEIRDDQTICFSCYKKSKNLKPIARDEVVLDCDIRENEFGDIGVCRVTQLMVIDGYKIEIYKSKGQKSYHTHIKNIPHISDLPKEQNELYKKLLIQKYIKKVREIIEAPELDKIDYTLCQLGHLVAEENKPHFKYKTIKKLIAVLNENNENFADLEIYRLAIQEKKEYKPIVKGSGITAKIIRAISIKDIARQFGLSLIGNKCLCPFHPDNKTPSLVFYEEQGRYCCFGCMAKGNIIKFYASLKELNPNFVYKKPQEQLK